MTIKENIETSISNALKSKFDYEMNIEDVNKILEVPKEKKNGDFSFPCFNLSRFLKNSPEKIANDLKDEIKIEKPIEKIEVIKGFLNFYVDKESIVSETIEKFAKQGADYGKSDMGNGKLILIESSSPNIAKEFHIGHLKTTIIGKSLYNLYKFLGYNVVRLNHVGDYGTQFAKLIVAYQRWGSEYDFSKQPIEQLTKLYVRINALCDEDKDVLEECRATFKKLEDGDEYCVNLWKKIKELSMEDYGGYKSASSSYFALIEFEGKKGERVKNIVGVPIYVDNMLAHNPNAFQEYCENQLGKKNVVILKGKIKKNSLISVDGFPMRLRGENDKDTILKGNMQLCLDEDNFETTRLIEKVLEKGENDINENYSKLKEERLIKLYDCYVEKMNTAYKKRPANQYQTLKEARDIFIGISIIDKVKVLAEIIKLLRCDVSTTANLSIINSGSNQGSMKVNKNTLGTSNTKLINQSVTGLFENKHLIVVEAEISSVLVARFVIR